MLGLPQATEVKRPLPKVQLYKKFELKQAQRDAIDADIARLDFVNIIAPQSLPTIAEGLEVKAIFVVKVELKCSDYNNSTIAFVAKLIPQKIVFALQYEEQMQLCVFHTRLLQSAWLPLADTTITLQGLSLDETWEHIVAEIGGLDTQSEQTIEQQITTNEQREKLLRQIETLEKRCRVEKQTKKKYELHQQIIKLKELIDKGKRI